jgi:hypothetical protein
MGRSRLASSGWVDVKGGLQIAFSNQNEIKDIFAFGTTELFIYCATE